MDAREKIANIIALVRDGEGNSPNKTSDTILALPELEAYFRSKFENEPGRLVAEKECDCYIVDGNPREDCPKCYGKLFKNKRRMTRREVEEWAINIVEDVSSCMDYNPDLLMLSSGERVSVEEK